MYNISYCLPHRVSRDAALNGTHSTMEREFLSGILKRVELINYQRSKPPKKYTICCVKNKIELVEEFKVLLLNWANKVIVLVKILLVDLREPRLIPK
jgi:hypothetical protein